MDFFRWRFTREPEPWPPPGTLPFAPPLASPPPAPSAGVTATLVNHCTFLLRTPTLTILTDPIWSERSSPVSWAGPRRQHPPAIAWETLPRVDLVLLSHDHYDHCDLPTLERLARRDAPLGLCPLGNGSLLREAGFAPDRIVELDWWETHRLADARGTATLTPARHWSNRATGPRNGRLWGGWHFDAPDRRKVFFAGDTAWDEAMFSEIGARLPAPDLALIPIGAYLPRWFMRPTHCDPAEAVAIHRAVAARRSLGMHWGTFPLGDDGFARPPQDLAHACAAAGLAADVFQAAQPGVTVAA